MKQILFFGLILLLSINHFTAQTPSDCTTNSLLLNEYEQDIENLALRRMFDVHSGDTSLVVIPPYWKDTIAAGLAAIFNATSLPERDTIFNIYCIHDHTGGPQRVHQQFIVQVDMSYSWTTAWQNMTALTGNEAIDNLVNEYNLEINNFYNWSTGDYAIVTTDMYINPYALFSQLEAIDGVVYAEPDAIIGGADKIMFTRIPNELIYDFFLEWNDCFDGCDNYRKWSFKVNITDCSVEYLGYEDGAIIQVQPIPTPLNCNTFVTSVNENTPTKAYSLYPNPSEETIYISTSTHDINRQYFLRDITGKFIKEGEISTSNYPLDISRLEAGIYTIQIVAKKPIYLTFIKK